MDEEFPTSLSKRRRTMSPEEVIKGEPSQSDVKPEPIYQPPQPDPAVKEEIDRKVAAENNFLDVLMQQVEAQSSRDQESNAVATSATNEPASSAAGSKTAVKTEEHAQNEPRAKQDGIEQTDTTDEASKLVPQTASAADATMTEAGEPPAQPPAEREWETDSSPYESDTSDDDDSSSSEDDSDDEDDGDYAMLNSEEAARILMQDDGGSDDEGKSKDNSAAGHRTAHEQPEEVIPKPDITVTENTPIVELGNVEFIVENTVLIKAKTSGEYQVLESGSALCLKDRSVIGAVAETIGRVEEPMYTVRFTNSEAINDAGVSQKGTTVYYVVPHSTFVFTQPLKAFKGSDASNFHDEEVGAEEMEFSDDEKEAEHKRQLKLKRQGRKDDGGRGGGRGRGRGGQQQYGGKMTTIAETSGSVTTLDYDDNGEGYTPLARPSNLHEMMTGAEPGEVSEPPPSQHQPRGGYQNNRSARGSRGRGNTRGGGRGGRGGAGGFSHHPPSHQNNHSFSSQQQQQQPPPFPFPTGQYPPFQGQPPSAPQLNPQQGHNSNFFNNMPFSPSPISPLPGGALNLSQQQQQLPQFPPFGNMPPPPPLPAGGFSFGLQQGQGQSQQQPQMNHAAFAQVQRQLAEMQRLAQQQQQHHHQGQG